VKVSVVVSSTFRYRSASSRYSWGDTTRPFRFELSVPDSEDPGCLSELQGVSQRIKAMDREPEKEALRDKLARCLQLAREFPHGPTADMIRDLEAELREQLRTLEADE
jgi:hypothetical protein